MPDEQNLLLVIATYNEVENLPSLVEQLQAQIPQLHLLIIDDNSPDGTGTWAQEASECDSNLFVIHRPDKLGLGSAAITGLKWAVARDYHLLATMDSDFSHRPVDLKQMVELARAEENQDTGVFIGSRYVAGGKIEGWPLFRKATSRILNSFARMVLRLKPRDNSGSLRVYRLTALNAIDLDDVSANGYAYLEEILWRLQHANVKFLEVPITFVDRERGKSKTSVKVGLSVFAHLLKLAFRSPRRS